MDLGIIQMWLQTQISTDCFEMKKTGFGLGGGYLRDYVRIVVGTDDGGLGGGGYLRDYVRVVGGTDDGDKGTDIMKDNVSQKNMCEEEVPLNNNIRKQIGDFVDMPSEAVEQGMDANVPDEINGAKGEQVPNHVVKKGNLEFSVCKELQTWCYEIVWGEPSKVYPLKEKGVC
ncbi:hypothetical protein Tco_0548842 [Tanacetum coccineum]